MPDCCCTYAVRLSYAEILPVVTLRFLDDTDLTAFTQSRHHGRDSTDTYTIEELGGSSPTYAGLSQPNWAIHAIQPDGSAGFYCLGWDTTGQTNDHNVYHYSDGTTQEWAHLVGGKPTQKLELVGGDPLLLSPNNFSRVDATGEVWSDDATNHSSLSDYCSDGTNIYLAGYDTDAGGQVIWGIDPSDGTELWVWTTHGVNIGWLDSISTMATDGSSLWIGGPYNLVQWAVGSPPSGTKDWTTVDIEINVDSVDTTSDTFTKTAHGFVENEVLYLNGTNYPGGTVVPLFPSGYSNQYYTATNVTTDTFKIAQWESSGGTRTLVDADITSAGTPADYTFTAYHAAAQIASSPSGELYGLIRQRQLTSTIFNYSLVRYDTGDGTIMYSASIPYQGQAHINVTDDGKVWLTAGINGSWVSVAELYDGTLGKTGEVAYGGFGLPYTVAHVGSQFVVGGRRTGL